MAPTNQSQTISSVKVNRYLKVSLDKNNDGYSDEVVNIIPGRKYDFEYVSPRDLSTIKTIRSALVTNILNASSSPEEAIIECIPNVKDDVRPPSKDRRLSFPLSNLRAVRYKDSKTFSKEAMIMVLESQSNRLRFVITKLQFIEEEYGSQKNYNSAPFKEIDLEIGKEYEFTYLNRDGMITRVDGILSKIKKTDRPPIKDCIIRESSPSYNASDVNKHTYDPDYYSDEDPNEIHKYESLAKDYDLTVKIKITTNYDDDNSTETEEAESRYIERILMLSCLRDCKWIQDVNPIVVPPKPVVINMSTLVDMMADAVIENIHKFTVIVDDEGDATLAFVK